MILQAEIETSIKAELGGALSPADKLLLARAAELLSKRVETNNQAVRSVNTASRIIAMLRAKYARPAEPEQLGDDIEGDLHTLLGASK